LAQAYILPPPPLSLYLFDGWTLLIIPYL
jgi:hypothetical protein